jgi:ribose transport system ATP-binding protein
MEPVLAFSHVTKRYPGVVALNDITTSFEPGLVHAFLGENGAGKSTLIKVLSGAIAPESGTIRVFGREYRQLDPRLSQSLGIEVIYQEFNLVPQLSIAENIFLGHESRRGIFLKRDYMNREAARVLASLGIDIDPGILVSDLSVAYMQLVEIAKAASREARILVMDEPTAPLTAKEVSTLFSLIRSLRESGVTILYISHRMEELFELSDTVTVLRDGEFIAKLPTKDASRASLIDMMVGRSLTEEFPRKLYPVCEEVLEVRGLRSRKIHDVSFHLCKGEILGIAGLVGAGRTELARLVFGADSHDAGDILVDGRAVSISSPEDGIRNGIALVPEDRKNQGLLLELAVRHNISLPSIKALSSLSFIDARRERAASGEFIKSLRIKTPGDEAITKNLSGGNQQKIVIAKWLGTRSKVLIFDEPTRGIDVGAKLEIYRLMHELASRGLGIIMISAEMPELLGMADRILVMRNGAIAGELDKGGATQSAILELAMGYVKESA